VLLKEDGQLKGSGLRKAFCEKHSWQLCCT